MSKPSQQDRPKCTRPFAHRSKFRRRMQQHAAGRKDAARCNYGEHGEGSVVVWNSGDGAYVRLATRVARVIAAGIALAAVVLGPSTAGADDQPILPRSVALTPTTDGYSGTLTYSNPTDVDFAVSSGGADPSGCEAHVSDDASMPKHSSGSIALTVEGCPAKLTGKEHLAVSVRSGTTTSVRTVAVSTASTAVTATGVTWPKDTLFLRRKGRAVTGEMTVVNTTSAEVRLEVVSGQSTDCATSIAAFHENSAKPKKAARVKVPAGQAVRVAVTAKSCQRFDSGTVTVTMKATAADGTKSDTAAISLQAEPNWNGLPRLLVASLALGSIVSVVGLVSVFGGEGSASGKKYLVVPADAPKSWLTAIGTLGPVITTLVTTSGVLAALTGSDEVPQSGLLVVVSAIAVVLVAGATLLANAALSTAKVDGKDQSCPRVWQFVAGAGITAGSAGFGVVEVALACHRLDIALSTEVYVLTAIGACLAIAAYTMLSVKYYVSTYARAPSEAAPATPAATNDLKAQLTEALAPRMPNTWDPTSPTDRTQLLSIVADTAAELVAQTTGKSGLSALASAAPATKSFFACSI